MFLILSLGLCAIFVISLLSYIFFIAILQGRAAALTSAQQMFPWTMRVIFLVIFTTAHMSALHRAVAPAIGGALWRNQPIEHPAPAYWTEEGRMHGVVIQVLSWPLLRLNAVEMSEASHRVSSRPASWQTSPWRRFDEWDAWLNSLLWGLALTALLDFAGRRLARLRRGPALRGETARARPKQSSQKQAFVG